MKKNSKKSINKKINVVIKKLYSYETDLLDTKINQTKELSLRIRFFCWLFFGLKKVK